MGNASKLTKWNRAIAALLKHPTLLEAAVSIKANEETMLGYLQNPDFSSRYQKARQIAAAANSRHPQKGCLPQVGDMSLAMVSDESGLTEKQRLFCLYFINNKNATMAAIKAGYSKGCAYQIGYENLRKPDVIEEINRLRQLKNQAILLCEEDIVEKMMRIAFADFGDFATFGSRDIALLDPLTGKHAFDLQGKLRYRQENYLIFKASDEVDSSLIANVKNSKAGMSLTLQNQQKALQWLTDYFGMNASHKHKAQYDAAVLALRERELAIKEF